MLGPIAGGLIVSYLHWRLIFFVNIPIGLVGLYMVYRHLPDYREHTDPLDVAGLILFGSGVALLSYVLEVFRRTFSERTRNHWGFWRLSICLLAGYGFHATKTPHPMLRLAYFEFAPFARLWSGSFPDASRHRGHSLSVSPFVSGGSRVLADSVRPADDAAGHRGHEPEDGHAAYPGDLGYRAVLVSNTLLIGIQICSSRPSGCARPCGSSSQKCSAMGSLRRCNTPA
jgi:hypothetical protein